MSDTEIRKNKSIYSGWDFWRGFLSGWTLLLVPYLILAPQYSDYTARARVSSIFMLMKSLKPLVESRIESNSSQSGFGERAEAVADLQHRHNALIHITQNGTIIGAGLVANSFGQNKRAGVIILEPRKAENGQIEWRCVGIPQREIPTLCRD